MRGCKRTYVENLQGEVWEYIEGYNGKYMVSNYGRVKYMWTWHKIPTEKILAQRKLKNGAVVTLSSDNVKKQYPYVHNLVADAFLKHPDNHLMIVKHIDDNPFNNNIKNLLWTIKSELMLNAFQLEIPKNNIHNYLDIRDIEIITNLCNLNVFTDEEIAYCFEVEPSEISAIREDL